MYTRTSIVRQVIVRGAAVLSIACFAGCAPETNQNEPRGSTESHLDDKKPDIFGACGSANQQPSASTPTRNLCLSGTATAVTGDGPWDWTCGGTGNGEKAHCFGLPSDVLFANPERDRHGALLKEVYAGVFGSPPADPIYFYWVERYNPARGVTCHAILEAFLLDSSARAAAGEATSANDAALTGYIEMLYRVLLPSFGEHNTAKIAGWRVTGQLTMDQLDTIFLDDAGMKQRCTAAGMQ